MIHRNLLRRVEGEEKKYLAVVKHTVSGRKLSVKV